MKKGEWFDSNHFLEILLYFIQSELVRLLGQVHHFSLLIRYPYSFRENLPNVIWTENDKSCFKNPHGTRGVTSGPHKVFTELESRYHIKLTTLATEQCQFFKTHHQVNPEECLLHIKMKKDYFNNCNAHFEDGIDIRVIRKEVIEGSQDRLLVRSYKIFKNIENVQSEIRCNKCSKEHKNNKSFTINN